MTIELHALQRIAVNEEPNSGFAVALTLPGTFVDVPFQEGSAALTLDRPILEPQTVQQRIDAVSNIVYGPDAATLQITLPLHATGVAAGNATQSPAHTSSALLMILKAAFGGLVRGTGTTSTGSSTADTLAATSGAGFQGGGAVGWVGAGSIYHLHEIAGVATNAVTLHQALPAAPANTNVLYGASTVYLTDNPDTSLQMLVEGAETDDRWLLLGGQLSGPPSISLGLGEIPTIQFSLTFAAWTSLAPGAITPASYANYVPIYTEGRMRSIEYGAAANTVATLCPSAVEPELAGPMYGPVMCPSGVNTILRWRRMRAVPVMMLNLSLAYENLDWFDARDDKDEYHLEYQVGRAAPGEGIVLSMPKARAVNVQRIDADGLAYQQVTFRADIDGETTNGSNAELARSAVRMHFG